MKTNRPIQAKNTQRILKAVLPSEFKIVSDKNSNGYKFINLLYGVEVDEIYDNLNQTYNDSFLPTFDASKEYVLYDVYFSGVPNTNILNSGSLSPIKITNEHEFYNGSPTRLTSEGFIPIPMHYLSYGGSEVASIAGFTNSFSSGFYTQCWSTVSGITGLEYIREDMRGSGYLIISSDTNQQDLYASEKYPLFVCRVGSNFKSSGDYKEIYGLFTGIRNQDYAKNNSNEILDNIDPNTLRTKYPMTREVIDESGIAWTIDHYTPYNGFVFNDKGIAVANVDYQNDYYYDVNGDKVYHRTYLNNPYGSGNYDIIYLDLQHVPISGTLKLYDMNILDYSGNATEIPSSGKSLYYYRSPYMLNGSGLTTDQFDPVYVGYEEIVPSGYNLGSNMEGQTATLLRTTSWDYLHDGGKLDPSTLTYVDGSGAITDRIKISGYYSKYFVEYKYLTHEKVKYVSSLEALLQVSLHSTNPIYSTYTSGNIYQLEYEFSKDPKWRENGDDAAKVITMDGLEVRPHRIIPQIDFSIPYDFPTTTLDKFVFYNTNKTYIGYSNEFVPVNTNFRNYVLDCPFDQTVVANTVTEQDLSGSGNLFTFVNTGSNKIDLINYGTYFGKKIIRESGDSYFQNSGVAFMKDNLFIHSNFKLRRPFSSRVFELFDYAASKYIILDIDINGRIKIESNGYGFNGSEVIEFNKYEKQIILQYLADELSSNIPTFNLYYKEQPDLGFRRIELSKYVSTSTTVNSSYINIFKNCEADIGNFKIYYEVQ